MPSAGLVIERQERVVRVRFDRPAAANAIDLSTAEALASALQQAVDQGAAAVVLEGNERFFSAGGDLRAMQSASDRSGYVRQLAQTLHQGLDAIAQSPTLLVSAVRGMAAGAGFGLVVQSDICICAETARFRAAYVSAGLTPDMGLSYLLQRAIGEARAKAMLLLDRTIDASTAESWGLVAEVVSPADFDDRVSAVIALLSNSIAPGRVKKLMSESAKQALTSQLDLEAASISNLITTPDAQLRVGAFVSGPVRG